MADLLAAAGTCVLVTLAPLPDTDLSPKLQPVLSRVPTLDHVVLVNLADRVRGPRHLGARLLPWREISRLHPRGGIGRALPPGIRWHDFGRGVASPANQSPAEPTALRRGRLVLSFLHWRDHRPTQDRDAAER